MEQPPRNNARPTPEIVFVYPPLPPERAREEARLAAAAEVIAWLYRDALKELSA